MHKLQIKQQEQEQSQMIKDLINPIDEDIKANIEVTDAGSVKEADGETLTYSVKLSNAVGSKCKK